MTTMPYVSAVLILLLTPGPTNTLMALASAKDGFCQMPKLLPAELCGYLTTILPLTWLGGEFMSRWTESAVLLKLAASVWLMFLAIRLWISSDLNASKHSGTVTGYRVYVTTVLNPKALVFGLAFLHPPEAPDYLHRLLILLFLSTVDALIWSGLSRLTQIGAIGKGRFIIMQRVASF